MYGGGDVRLRKSLVECVGEAGSFNVLNGPHRHRKAARRQPMSRSDRENAIQPAVLLRPGFEPRSDAKVILRWLDGLAARETIHDLRGAVAKTAVSHRTWMTVSGFNVTLTSGNMTRSDRASM